MVDGAMYPHPGPLLPHGSLQHSYCSMSAQVWRGAGGNDRLVSAVFWVRVIRILCCSDNNRLCPMVEASERKTVGSHSQNMNVKWTDQTLWVCWENLPGYWHVEWHLFCVSILCHKIIMNTAQSWFRVTQLCLASSTSSDARHGLLSPGWMQWSDVIFQVMPTHWWMVTSHCCL